MPGGATTIGAGIALDGEREFRQALADINGGLRVTASELTLLTAQYANNSSSMQALQERGRVLETQFRSQTERVTTLRQALQQSIQTYGENNSRTRQWQVQLNQAQTELVRVERAIEQNNEAMQQAGEATQQYGETTTQTAEATGTFGERLNGVIEGLGIELPGGASNAIQSLNATKASTLALAGAVAGLVAGFAKTTMETAKHAAEIQNVSKTAGMTTDAYQEWDYILKQNSYSMEEASGDMAALSEKILEAASGSGEAAEFFNLLHIKVKDGHGVLKTQGQILDEFVTKLQGVTNETKRNAIASAMMGTTGEKLMPLFSMTTKEIAAMKKEARDMGYVISEENIKKFIELANAMQKVDQNIESFKNSIALGLLEPLTVLFNLLGAIPPKLMATIAIVGTLSLTALSVVKSIASVSMAFSMASGSGLKTIAVIVGLTAAAIALVGIIAVLLGKGPEVSKTFNDIGQGIGKMTNSVNNASAATMSRQQQYVNGSYAAGLKYVPYDGFVARVHKGEAILTADENPNNPNATNGRGGDTYIFQVNMEQIREVQELSDLVKRSKQVGRAGKVAIA